MQHSKRLHLLALLAICAFFSACDKVALTSPTGSTITLTVSQTTIPINGSTEVTASVVESGGTAVHNGTIVTFTGGFGTFSPQEAPTVGGIARTTFTGNASGTARIGAFSGAAKATEVEIRVGSAAAGAVSVRTEPATVSQNGGTVSVIALVTDTSGNPLPGVNVVFSTDNGILATSTAISGSDGVARTQLTTNRTSRIRAAVADKSGETTVTAVAAPTVTIQATTPNPVAGAPVAFRITPPAATSTSNPIDRIIVDFGDGSSQTLTGVTGEVGVTHVYNREGGYTATATAFDINGQRGVSSTSVVVGRQQLPTVNLSAPPTTTTTTATAINFSAQTQAPGAQIVSARVTLQDGTVIYSGTNANSFNYRFGGTGTYTLTGTATDSNGNSASAQTSIVVNP